MGEFLRPKASVLPDSAVIPPRNLLQPPPNRFTHLVRADQPYYYEADASGGAAGTFMAGTPVLLLSHDGGALCHVADARGLFVATRFDGLDAFTSAEVSDRTGSARAKKPQAPR